MGGPLQDAMARASKRTPTTMRMSPEARDALAWLSANLGITRSAVMEVAIRLLAEQRGYGVPQQTTDRET